MHILAVDQIVHLGREVCWRVSYKVSVRELVSFCIFTPPDEESCQLPAGVSVVFPEGGNSDLTVHHRGSPQPVVHAERVDIVDCLDVENVPASKDYLARFRVHCTVASTDPRPKTVSISLAHHALK